MLIQGLWNTDSPLLQIPFFTSEIVDKCKEAGVESVLDILELEDETRNVRQEIIIDNFAFYWSTTL